MIPFLAAFCIDHVLRFVPFLAGALTALAVLLELAARGNGKSFLRRDR